MKARAWIFIIALCFVFSTDGLVSFCAAEPKKESAKGLYALEANNIFGEKVALSQYAGKVVMVVNTASKCGYTPQYEGLENLYKKYKDKGFVVLGFPSNDFLWQEPGSNEEIKKFCDLKYHVTFPMFAKNKVKGRNKQKVFYFLTEEGDKKFRGDPNWNFTKFLVNKEGKVVARFSPSTKPTETEIIQSIEDQLGK